MKSDRRRPAKCVMDLGDGVGVRYQFENRIIRSIRVNIRGVGNIAPGFALGAELGFDIHFDAIDRDAALRRFPVYVIAEAGGDRKAE